MCNIFLSLSSGSLRGGGGGGGITLLSVFFLNWILLILVSVSELVKLNLVFLISSYSKLVAELSLSTRRRTDMFACVSHIAALSHEHAFWRQFTAQCIVCKNLECCDDDDDDDD